jgi:hypothetical protein
MSGSLSTSVTVPLFVNPSTNTVPATMISPAPNATLPPNSVVFSWTTGVGVSQYELDAGSFSTTGTATSATVTNLPSGQSTIAVKLKSLISSQWQTQTYTYLIDTVSHPTAPSLVSKGSTTPIATLIYNNNQQTEYNYNFTDPGCTPSQCPSSGLQSCKVYFVYSSTNPSRNQVDSDIYAIPDPQGGIKFGVKYQADYSASDNGPAPSCVSGLTTAYHRRC